MPDDDWAPAIFKPEAGMSRYDIRCTDNGFLGDIDHSVTKEIAEEYNIPDNKRMAEWMILKDSENNIRAFCQAICDMAGMSCNLTFENENGTKNIVALLPQKDPAPDFENLLNEIDNIF